MTHNKEIESLLDDLDKWGKEYEDAQHKSRELIGSYEKQLQLKDDTIRTLIEVIKASHSAESLSVDAFDSLIDRILLLERENCRLQMENDKLKTKLGFYNEMVGGSG